MYTKNSVMVVVEEGREMEVSETATRLWKSLLEKNVQLPIDEMALLGSLVDDCISIVRNPDYKECKHYKKCKTHICNTHRCNHFKKGWF